LGGLSVNQFELAVDAIMGGFNAILGVAAIVAALTALMFLIGSLRAMRRPVGSPRYKDDPHGGHGHHGGQDHGSGGGYGAPYESGPSLEFELGQITEKLDRITAAVDPKGWGLLRRMTTNVFWSVFGVVAGIVIQALWAPQISYY
jgi:hypothetical protein